AQLSLPEWRSPGGGVYPEAGEQYIAGYAGMRRGRWISGTYPCAVSTPDQPPEPLDPPMTPFAVAGLAAWALLGLVLLPFRGTLVAHGHGWWLWMCLAGVGGGVAGLIVMRRHDA